MSGRNLISIKSGVAVLLLVIFLGMGFFGPLFAPYDEDFQESLMKITNEQGEVEYLFSPARPTEWHLLGTNDWGYDMLSLILYGARYTVISVTLIAAVRTALGGVLGMFLAVRGGPRKSGRSGRGQERRPASPGVIGGARRGFSFLGGVPVFIILLFAVYRITMNPESIALVLSIQAGLIVILGIPHTSAGFRERTRLILAREFIESAVSVGAGTGRLIRRHILPHLKETFVITFVNELMIVLNLLGILGIFNVFLGGTAFTPSPPLFHSQTHEWAGLIGQARGNNVDTFA